MSTPDADHATKTNSNQADLLKLEGVFKQLGMKERPYSHVAAHSQRTNAKRPFTLKRLAIALRFIAKLRIASREWQKHERTRKMLADKWESYKREDRIRAHQLRFREARAAAAFVPSGGEGRLKGVALP